MTDVHELFARYKTTQDFLQNPPSLDDLRKALPSIAYLFAGQLGETPNVYFDGRVASLPIVGSGEAKTGIVLVKDSTLGMIEPGEYEFPTDYRERLTVLDGQLDAYVDGNSRDTFRPIMSFVADGERLKIAVPSNSFYVCEYLPGTRR